MDYILNQIDTFVTYLEGLSLSSILNTYWFLFFLEFPRYYLAESLVVLYRCANWKSIVRQEEQAAVLLYRDNPLVTILVPGKNEGKHIYKLTMSLKEQTYRNYEVIIVDDGSDDSTPLICTDLERRGLIDLYLRLNERGGKASAANFGAYYAKGKYIVHLDADSSLDRDAIEKILLPFYMDPDIKAVGGCVKVRNNRENICTSVQALEYLKTIMVGRTVTSALGIYRVISGAFGAFEVQTLKQVGYWDIGPGLDGDITQKIRKAGWKVSFANNAICMTNVPVRWKKLFKQRLRWSKSLIRFRVRKHRDILLPNRNFSILNFLSNLENIFYDSVLNFIWLFYIINLVLTRNDHFFEIVLLGFFIRYCFSMLAFLIILIITERRREELYLFAYLPFVSIYNGYFLRFARLIAHTQELFFFSSYKDPWNPRKTSVCAQLENA
ncbi:glycosyltransferase family 2 protein [Phocaeicola plebeius]